MSSMTVKVYKHFVKIDWAEYIYIKIFPQDYHNIWMISIIGDLLSSILSLVIIFLLNAVGAKGARVLTKMEHHRTQEEFDKSYSLKIFCVYFFNHYTILFYIAFFQQLVHDHPGENIYHLDSCRGGCNYQLSIQLSVIMVGKQIIKKLKQALLPKLIKWFKWWFKVWVI